MRRLFSCRYPEPSAGVSARYSVCDGCRCPDKQGSLLVISLWILFFFSLLAVAVARISVSQLRLFKNLEDRVVSLHLAKAGCVYIQESLRRDTTASYDTLKELKSPLSAKLGRGGFSAVIGDEESKMNINTASAEELSRLPMLSLEQADEIVNSTLRPFRLKEEILLLEGVTPEVYGAVSPYITVYGEGKVNINTASPEVLRAVGFSEELLAMIVNFRSGTDGEEGTYDDGEFTQAETLIDTLKSSFGLSAAQEEQLLQLKQDISVDSSVFSAEIKTDILDKPVGEYRVILNVDKIRQWKEL